MKIIKANIIDLWSFGKTICVTTNGFVKRDGSGVMGAGSAGAISKALTGLEKNLGSHIKRNGNNVGFIADRIIAFPTKPSTGQYKNSLDYIKKKFKEGDVIPGFWCKSDINLIWRSMEQLNKLIEIKNLEEVYLPTPGVSNGGLSIDEVNHVLEKASEKIIFVRL